MPMTLARTKTRFDPMEMPGLLLRLGLFQLRLRKKMEVEEARRCSATSGAALASKAVVIKTRCSLTSDLIESLLVRALLLLLRCATNHLQWKEFILQSIEPAD